MAFTSARAKLVPISEATNSYDLLEDLKKVIREEPLRLDMSDWIITFAGDNSYFHSDEPECGTVACCAGWLSILRRHDIITGRTWLSGLPDFKEFPQEVWAAMNGLFYTFPEDKRNEDGIRVGPKAGTVEYAEIIVAKISAIQAEYAELLRAHQLQPVQRSMVAPWEDVA